MLWSVPIHPRIEPTRVQVTSALAEELPNQLFTALAPDLSDAVPLDAQGKPLYKQLVLETEMLIQEGRLVNFEPIYALSKFMFNLTSLIYLIHLIYLILPFLH